MINGKFYAGLPEKMMEKQTGPNRQKTNFYWPNESNTESSVETKSKRRQKLIEEKSTNNYNSSAKPTSVKSNIIEPKDLFKKQLSSKIEFYDVIPDDTKQKNSNSSNNNVKSDSIKNKINGAFASKIEFYDFIDNNTNQMTSSASKILRTVDKNSKKELEKSSKNSPKLKDKRIKFTENEEKEIESSSSLLQSAPKGILKNNETTLPDQSKKSHEKQTKEKLIKKRNMSKSVENLSRSKSVGDFVNDNNIKIIENDVKKLNLRTQDRNHYNDYNGDLNENENKELEHQKPITKKNFKWGQTDKEIEDNTSYGIKQKTRTTHDFQEDKPDLNGNDWETNSRNHTKMQNGLQTLGNRSFGNHIEENVKVNVKDESKSYEKISSTTTDRPSPSTTFLEKNNQTVENEGHIIKQSSMTSNTVKSPDKTQLVNRAHRHLVSNINNIIFGGNDNDNETINRISHKTARNSAVTRVSVGLPD